MSSSGVEILTPRAPCPSFADEYNNVQGVKQPEEFYASLAVMGETEESPQTPMDPRERIEQLLSGAQNGSDVSSMNQFFKAFGTLDADAQEELRGELQEQHKLEQICSGFVLRGYKGQASSAFLDAMASAGKEARQQKMASTQLRLLEIVARVAKSGGDPKTVSDGQFDKCVQQLVGSTQHNWHTGVQMMRRDIARAAGGPVPTSLNQTLGRVSQYLASLSDDKKRNSVVMMQAKAAATKAPSVVSTPAKVNPAKLQETVAALLSKAWSEANGVLACKAFKSLKGQDAEVVRSIAEKLGLTKRLENIAGVVIQAFHHGFRKNGLQAVAQFGKDARELDLASPQLRIWEILARSQMQTGNSEEGRIADCVRELGDATNHQWKEDLVAMQQQTQTEPAVFVALGELKQYIGQIAVG